MGHAQGPIGIRGWSKGLVSIEVNRPSRRKNDSELVVSLEEPSFPGKVLWKVGTQMPRGHCARSNHTSEDKFQGNEPTVT